MGILVLLFNLVLKMVRPNFSILKIKSLKRDSMGGFWLEETETQTDNCIVEYKYSNKTLKHLLKKGDRWPPTFTNRNPKISSVLYKGVDKTKNVSAFAGPLQNDFNPLGLFVTKRKPRIMFSGMGLRLTWEEYLEFQEIDTRQLIIRRC
jgi:hypothetical protein